MDVHKTILEDCRETVVVLVAPSCTVEDVHTLICVVLVEALVQVVEADAVGHHVCTGRLVEGSTTCCTTATELEAVTVDTLYHTTTGIGIVTCMVCPAVVDYYRVICHVEVPVVVGVIPCTASVELCARTREQFNSKTVGVATVVRSTVCLGVSVLVRVAVDDLVVTAVRVVRVELRSTADRERLCLLNREVLEHTNLQTSVVVVAEGTTLNDIVRTLHLHTVVLGMLQNESVECPVVGKVVDVDTTRLLEGNL